MPNSNQTPPPSGAPAKDMIVITRLNTVGLKRLAEGSLVPKKPFESHPPQPMRASEAPRSSPPGASPSMPVPPPMVTPSLIEAREFAAGVGSSEGSSPELEAIDPLPLDSLDQLGTDDDLEMHPADADDPTIGLGAEASDDRTVTGPAVGFEPPALDESDLMRLSQPAPVETQMRMPSTLPAPIVPSQPPMVGQRFQRVLEQPETPTAMFVKDVSRLLSDELKKAPPAPMPSTSDIGFADTLLHKVDGEEQQQPAMFSLDFEEAKKPSAPPPRAPQESSVISPAKAKVKAASSPPGAPRAVTSAAAAMTSGPTSQTPSSLRSDPAGVAVSTREGRERRVRRKGGFLPWAAALTALGVFVGVAGARVATGAVLRHTPATQAAAAQPAPLPVEAPAPIAGPVAAPELTADTAKPAAAATEPTKEEQTAKTEGHDKVEAAPTGGAAADGKQTAPAEKLANGAASLAAEKPTPVADKPKPEAPHRSHHSEAKPVERPEPAPKPEAVAAKPSKPAPVEKADKVEPPKPKSPDVAAAARDYAAVESQLGQSL